MKNGSEQKTKTLNPQLELPHLPLEIHTFIFELLSKEGLEHVSMARSTCSLFKKAADSVLTNKRILFENILSIMSDTFSSPFIEDFAKILKNFNENDLQSLWTLLNAGQSASYHNNIDKVITHLTSHKSFQNMQFAFVVYFYQARLYINPEHRYRDCQNLFDNGFISAQQCFILDQNFTDIHFILAAYWLKIYNDIRLIFPFARDPTLINAKLSTAATNIVNHISSALSEVNGDLFKVLLNHPDYSSFSFALAHPDSYSFLQTLITRYTTIDRCIEHLTPLLFQLPLLCSKSRHWLFTLEEDPVSELKQMSELKLKYLGNDNVKNYFKEMKLSLASYQMMPLGMIIQTAEKNIRIKRNENPNDNSTESHHLKRSKLSS